MIKITVLSFALSLAERQLLAWNHGRAVLYGGVMRASVRHTVVVDDQKRLT